MASQKVSGDLTLDVIKQRIRSVELGGFQFIGNTINGTWNVVYFSYANLPSDLHLLPSSATPPSDATIFWKGEFLVGKKEIAVNAYRKQTDAQALVMLKSSNDASIALLPEAGASPISRDSVVARALSGVGSDTAYSLHDKRNPPLSAELWPSSGMRTDCSSYVAWCLRMSSRVSHPLYLKKNGGWFETSAVYEDGVRQSGFFTKVAQAQPGSILVYGDKNGREGHIGIVIETIGAGIAGVTAVAHCSSSNFKTAGKAILVTKPKAWLDRSDSIIVDFEGFN